MHPAYRRDVDGLRAVAVLSVVAFHATPSWMPGGFAGVDIFFVISGYLISSIVLANVARGTFSLADFYVRRIKRIFPALILMLAAVLTVGWFVLYPDEHQQLGKHIAAGVGFVSNVVLWRESGYFDVEAELKPLLHLWSLGIEEQFYILWPLLLALTWRWRSSQWPLILGIAALSFALNLLRARGHPATTFYLPFTRIWELLVGCTLAYAQLFKADELARWQAKLFFSGESGPDAHSRDLQAYVGLCLLAVALCLLDRYRVFPGWWAALPTMGAFLLISAGPEAWVNRVLLGNRLMVAIGLISYPLYLWHWPLLSFTRIISPDEPNSTLVLTAVGLAFLFAALTYWLVERPIRSYRNGPRVAIPLAAIAAVLGVIGIVAFSSILPPRSAAFNVAKYLRPSKETLFPGPNLQPITTPLGRLLAQGSAPGKILFIGDSNIEQYYPRLDHLLTQNPDAARGIVFASSGGCIPIPHVMENHHPWCPGVIERGLAYANKPEVETVVIGAAWYAYFVEPMARYSYYFDDGRVKGPLILGATSADSALQALETTLSDLTRSGKRVYLVLPIPAADSADPRGMVKRSFTDLRFRIEALPLDRVALAKAYGPLKSKLTAVGQRSGAHVIDPFDALCDGTICSTVDAHGEPIYRDGAHLRPSYVRHNIHFFDEIVLPQS
ncbi:MAG: acyltransferase [Proteobacteria bacterium]|nr:acyltransferase [Pseudomonadota bacterium]